MFVYGLVCVGVAVYIRSTRNAIAITLFILKRELFLIPSQIHVASVDWGLGVAISPRFLDEYAKYECECLGAL